MPVTDCSERLRELAERCRRAARKSFEVEAKGTSPNYRRRPIEHRRRTRAKCRLTARVSSFDDRRNGLELIARLSSLLTEPLAVLWVISILMPIAPSSKSTIAVVPIHITRISLFSAFGSG